LYLEKVSNIKQKRDDLREREKKVGPLLVFLFFAFVYCFLFPLVDQDSLLCFSFLTFCSFFCTIHTHTHEKIEGETLTVSYTFLLGFLFFFSF
jgi:hypothetical protein